MSVLSNQAVKTYRYLRVGMATLIFMLFAAIIIERIEVERCFQTSVSAYYYTPVHPIFVSALVSLGVCMVVIKGNSELEDILLNVGGMLAPIVAFVPTPSPGRCRSVPMTLRDTSSEIANNVVALIAAGIVGVLIMVWIAIKERNAGTGDPWDASHVIGLLVAAGILTVGIVWFVRDRTTFDARAHYWAAGALFVSIVVVVFTNARGYAAKRASASESASIFANRYAAIAGSMIVSVVGIILWKVFVGWDHALLVAEAALIGLFAVFWMLQTWELWNEGLREGAEDS
jgi:hypothetical protein